LETKRVGSGLLLQSADKHELALADLKIVTVKQPTPSARATRMHLVDGFTVRFTTTASPRSGSALIDDRTLWLLPREA
jgi:hypothetical protein